MGESVHRKMWPPQVFLGNFVATTGQVYLSYVYMTYLLLQCLAMHAC